MGSNKPTKNSLARHAARADGKKRFFTGDPCIHGHIAERYVSTGDCSVCVSVLYNKWRKENKEKHLNATRDWKRRKKDDPEYKKKNIVRVLKWKDDFPLAFKANLVLRKARNKKAEGRFSGKDIQNILEKQKYLCCYCQRDLKLTKYHIDHKQPLARGGTNWPDNIQCLCPTCNLKKSKKTSYEYMSFCEKEFIQEIEELFGEFNKEDHFCSA